MAEQLKNRSSFDSAIIFFRKAADNHLKNNQYPEWVKGVSGLIDCYKSKGDKDEAMRLPPEMIFEV